MSYHNNIDKIKSSKDSIQPIKTYNHYKSNSINNQSDPRLSGTIINNKDNKNRFLPSNRVNNKGPNINFKLNVSDLMHKDNIYSASKERELSSSFKKSADNNNITLLSYKNQMLYKNNKIKDKEKLSSEQSTPFIVKGNLIKNQAKTRKNFSFATNISNIISSLESGNNLNNFHNDNSNNVSLLKSSSIEKARGESSSKNTESIKHTLAEQRLMKELELKEFNKKSRNRNSNNSIFENNTKGSIAIKSVNNTKISNYTMDLFSKYKYLNCSYSKSPNKLDKQKGRESNLISNSSKDKDLTFLTNHYLFLKQKISNLKSGIGNKSFITNTGRDIL
jgi:hypothetical protein